MRLSAPLLCVAFAAGCHPLACFIPADLPRDPPLILVSNDAFPKSDVEVDVDDLGIPHIYGKSEADLAYALGVMHGRERLFQIFDHAGIAAGHEAGVGVRVAKDMRFEQSGVDALGQGDRAAFGQGGADDVAYHFIDAR